MIRYIFLLFIFVSISQSVIAQNDLQSQVALLQKSQSPQERLQAYQKIYSLYEFSDADSAIFYMQKGVKEFETSNYKVGRAHLLTLLGGAYSTKGLLSEAKSSLNLALKLFKELGDQNGIATTYNSIGVIEGKTGNYDVALKDFYEALRIFESIHEEKGIVKTYVKLGVAYEYNGNYNKSLFYYKKALDKMKDGPVRGDLITLYNNIGSLHCRKEEYKVAIPYFEKALELSSTPQFKQMKSFPLLNLGKVYEELNDKEKALHYLNAALTITEQEKIPDQEAIVLLNIAQLVKDPNEALSYLDKAYVIARDIDERILLMQILEIRTKIFEQTGEYKNALNSLHELKVLEDSLFNIQKAKEIANLQSVYELEKSNTKLDQLEAAYKRNTFFKNIIISIATILALLLILVSIFFWRIRNLNNQLSKNEQELKKTNDDKDRLFSIIGHDLRSHVSNVPTVLEMHESDELSEEEKRYLLESLKENAIATMDTLDKLLNWGKSQLKGINANLSVFAPWENVENKLKLMKTAAEQKMITMENNVPKDIKVYADQEHFKFILRNLLSNAIKYTHHNGHIEIDATRKKGYVVFSVTDNGVGIDKYKQQSIFEPFNKSTEGTDHEKGNSIGLMLTKEFVEKNGGEIWVESEKGKGTTFYFSLKEANAL